MVKALRLLALVSLICCSSAGREKTDQLSSLTFIHIGERKGDIYFREVGSNALYKLGTEKKMSLFRNGQKELEPRQVNEKAIIYTRSDNKSILIEFFAGQKKEIKSGYEIEKLCSDDDLNRLYVQDKHTSQIGFVELQSDEFKLTVFKGSNLKFESGMLYFTQESIDSEGYVNLYRSSNLTEKELLLGNVFEDGLYLFPGGDFLICQISVDGQPTKAVYSFLKKGFHLIKNEEIQRGNFYSYFDVNTKAITFYKPRDFLVKEVVLPDTYEYKQK